MESETRTCKKCKQELPVSNFYFRKDSNKYRDNCKECVKGQVKKNALLNIDKIKERNKAFRAKNKEKIAFKNKEWRKANPGHRKEYVKNNPEIIKAVAKKTYLKHKDKVNAKKKEWYQKNKQRHAEKREAYAIKNKDRLLAARRKWERNRMDTDINYLLQKTLRGRVREALKSTGGRKAERTESLIGCTVQEFRQYIETQFKDGMSWDNWAFDGWHLDHKVPVSWFNLENENCRKLAFNYKNMQPLWWQENFSKNNRYSHKISD